MHLTIFSVRLIALLAVIAAVLVAFSGVGPGAPREASAEDKKVELQFFELGGPVPPKKDWTGPLVKIMLADANIIWAPAGISFNWPKNPNITPLADPQPVGNNGSVKTPAAGNKVQILKEYPDVDYQPDPKTPSEVDQACIAANELLNPASPGQNVFPVILVQDFVDAAGNPIGVLGLTLVNPSGAPVKNPPTGETAQGVNGDQIGAGLCILIDKDAQGVQVEKKPLPPIPPPPIGAPGKVLAHELGHAMCLPHDTDPNNLMFGSVHQGPGPATPWTGANLAGDQLDQKGDPLNAQAMLCNKKVQDKLKLDLTGVTCNDVWLDVSALIALAVDPDLPLDSVLPKGEPHDPDPVTGDLLVGKAITRIEPSQKQKGAWDVTTVTYLGPEIEGFEPPQTPFDFAIGELIPDEPPTKLDCQQKSQQADGTTAEQQFKAIVPLPTFNQITVDVFNKPKLSTVKFLCQSNDKTAQGVLTNVQGGAERWTGTFDNKCISSLPNGGVTMTSVANVVTNQWEIKDCFVSNGLATEQCNLEKIISAPTSPQVDKLTVKNPAYDRIDVDIPNATAEKLVKSVLFRCQNSGEKVLGENKGLAGGIETWSATFVQKCISDKPGEGVDLFLNPVAAPVTISGCQVENIGTAMQAPCILNAGPPPPAPAGERGLMNPLTKFSAVGNKRGGSASKIVNKDLDNNPLTPDVPTLRSSTCAFSEASKVWIRTDTNSTLVNSGPGAKNLGTAVLYLGTSSPSDPNDGTTCKILNDGPGGAEDTIIFPSILESHSRDATTDFPGEQKNIDNSIATDGDGPTNPAKGDPQDPDGTTELPFVADDWDGDGCPDWDELDKDFINGRDPFNPTDCNTKDDYTGTYNILATVAPAAKEGVLTGTIAKVKVVTDKVIKDDKHIQVDLLVSNLKGQSLKNNQKIYWDTDDPLQEGWWQVKQGSIIEGGIQPTATPAQTDKSVTLNRLFAPPCGTTIGVPPAVPAPAEGQLVGVQCVGDVQEGSYFHCIARIDETLDNELDGNVVCYIDSGGLSSLPPVSAVPSFADGNAGPPPPPPYGTAAPNQLSGEFDKLNQRIIIEVCFANVGGFLGPNVVVRANVDANSLKGFANIWRSRSIAECDAKVPNAGEPFLQVEVVFARQTINFDHDEDGCSDYDELGHGKTPPPAKKNCGDDPYNPYDSDTDFSGPSSTLATVTRADACSKGLPIVPCAGDDEIAGNEDDLADKTVVPGAGYHCISNNIPTGENTYDTPIYCYIDIPGVDVNPEASPNVSGDGLPGSPPPLPYGDVESNHSVLTTTYDKENNRLLTMGCFNNKDGEGSLGWVWVESNIDAHTGLGTVNIHILQAANCVGSPTGPPAPADVETAEQPPDWDSDGDGCTDAKELRQAQSAGGLRDPFNQWDFMDTWATGSQTGNVDGFDIGDVVVRFGQVGDPTGDPHEEPTANDNYHTASDRTSPILGANPWNLPGPSGNIDGFDIGAVVVQFGHTCL